MYLGKVTRAFSDQINIFGALYVGTSTRGRNRFKEPEKGRLIANGSLFGNPKKARELIVYY